ncbi:MAG: carboxymuconolactone decarboxylase family protein [Pelagibacterales bacterium]|nr:carboxymuconolactone decarboxylase family protein [Pelagibacterales bacterium]
MMRIKDWNKEDLSEEQLSIYKEIINGPRGNVIGPIRIWLNNPQFALCAQALGKYARYESNLSSALSELAIITTGRCWSSEFEWEQHAPLAEKAGIDINYINEIALGNRPIFENKDQQAVYDFAAEVNINKNVSDKVYNYADDLLGKNVLIDIVAICGYYSLISMTLNVFKVPSIGSAWVLPKIKNFNHMLP